MSTKESKTDCSGEYPALWRIRYKYEQTIRHAAEGGGVDEAVTTKIAEGEYDVVAINAPFAMATFLTNCPVYVGDLRGTSPVAEFIAYVDAITLTQKNYGGHFS